MNRNQLALVTALVSVLQFLTGTAQHFLTHTILLPLVAPLFPKHPFKQGRVEAQSPRKCQYQSEIVINHLKPAVFKILLSTFRSRKSSHFEPALINH